jgi:hypothetical protein
LRLTKGQSAQLADALKARVEVYHDLVRSRPTVSSRLAPDLYAAAIQQWKAATAQKVAALDQPIWEILSPSPLRALAALLNKPVAGYEPAKLKANRKGVP